MLSAMVWDQRWPIARQSPKSFGFCLTRHGESRQIIQKGIA